MISLPRLVSVMGHTSTDGELVGLFRELSVSPPEAPDDTVTTDENEFEFRFEGGVLVEAWVNPGSSCELPHGLRWDMSPDELRSSLGPGAPLGIDKSNPGAFQWLIAPKLFLHMNVDGGFSLRASTGE